MERLIEIDPYSPDLLDQIIALKSSAMRALDIRALPAGNPDMARMRENSVSKRRRVASAFHKSIIPLIDNLRAKGCVSYRQIAEGLDQSGIKPPRSDRWSISTVRAIDKKRGEI